MANCGDTKHILTQYIHQYEELGTQLFEDPDPLYKMTDDELRDRIKELEQKLRQEQREKADLQREMSQTRAENEGLRDQVNRMEGRVEALEKIVETLKCMTMQTLQVQLEKQSPQSSIHQAIPDGIIEKAAAQGGQQPITFNYNSTVHNTIVHHYNDDNGLRRQDKPMELEAEGDVELDLK